MNWQNSHFLKSITDISDKPNSDKDEIAVIGRSNVGKSSLINALVSRKNLARVSRTPGKTQLINYYSIDDIFFLVDLPGYGFAKVSRQNKVNWKLSIERYLKDNRYIRCILLLIDCRHSLMDSDRQMIDWLKFYRIPFIIVLTKSDKLSNNQLIKQESIFKVMVEEVEILPFSTFRNKSHSLLKKKILMYISKDE